MPQNFIETLDDQLLYERSESFRGGMDAFTRASLLQPDQYALGQNVILTDNHLLKTRWGLAGIFSMAATGTSTFTNADAIQFNSTIADTYPTTLTVAALVGAVLKVTFTLTGVALGDQRICRLLLVSPTGRAVLLMAGAGTFNVISAPFDMVLDDEAAQFLPEGVEIVAGTYKPKAYDYAGPAPGPAPGIPYALTLSEFIGDSPNGVWLLYPHRNPSSNGASVAGGWKITITTTTDPQPHPFSGPCQGLTYFDTPTYEQLVGGGGGAALRYWDGGAWTNIGGYTPANATLMLDMAQGINKLYITDGVAQWASWSGAAAVLLGTTAGTTTSDPPVGATILCWHTNRMFAAGFLNNPDTVYASFILDASATKWDHVNFKFRVGGGEGEYIMALVSVQDFILAVLKEDSIYVVNTDPTLASAALWTIKLVTNQLGCVGKRAWCKVGNDVLFMASDGVRSLQRMSSTETPFEVSPPLSEPMQPYIDRINWAYATTICAVKYREFALFAVPLDNDTTPRHVLVWNARVRSWMGVFTGWQPLQFVVSRFTRDNAPSFDLRLVFGDQNGDVMRWQDREDELDEATFEDNGADVATLIRTRSMLFGEPVSDKDGHFMETRYLESTATARVALIGDDLELARHEQDLSTTQNQLPVDLPFDLFSPKPTTLRKGLGGAGPFNEAYLEISSDRGKLVLKNCTIAAFLNTISNEN